jgi:hypothetical protein
LLGLALTRYVLRLPPLSEMSHAEVQEWMAPVLRYYLTGRPVDAGADRVDELAELG